jgi:hypothetical protein
MTTLQGSPKQVAWAEQLRTALLADLDRMIDDAERLIARAEAAPGSEPKPDSPIYRYPRVLRHLRDHWARETLATRFINARGWDRDPANVLTALGHGPGIADRCAAWYAVSSARDV